VPQAVAVEERLASTLSERSWGDAQAPMGHGATRVLDRVLAACGLLGEAPLEFIAADDVPHAGVLCALPGLLVEGLLRHTREMYQVAAGFYPLESVFLALALLALVRCTALEQTRYLAPGEWGKLLGLDRLPEVKTLRGKLSALCATPGQAGRWQARLSKEWMAGNESESLGMFYADGHVRVYHGELTDLPRRYVARERLCLRGTTDYWINGLGGAPFFVLTQPVNPGLIQVLRHSVVPRLLSDAAQPSAEALGADARLMRFTLVFDREGYSPEFFAELAQQRIAILTYHKFPGEHWPEAEFSAHTIRLHTGQVVELNLAERGTRLANGLWVREVRERGDNGAQSAILCTDARADLTRIAACMGARWSQENFFRYMRQHYGLDRLIEYGTEPIPETAVVVNPAWRQLDQRVRRERAILHRLQAQFGALAFPSQPSASQVQHFEHEGGLLHEKITQQAILLDQLKEQRRDTPPKLTLKELPEEQRFAQLKGEKKRFIDTLRLIAYRAESAMAGEVREVLAREDDARTLLRRLFNTPGNLRPDLTAQTLTIELHRLGSPLQDAAVTHLCTILNDSETCYPTTSLRLIFRQVGST
jgi:hypothetical protein